MKADAEDTRARTRATPGTFIFLRFCDSYKVRVGTVSRMCVRTKRVRVVSVRKQQNNCSGLSIPAMTGRDSHTFYVATVMFSRFIPSNPSHPNLANYSARTQVAIIR